MEGAGTGTHEDGLEAGGELSEASTLLGSDGLLASLLQLFQSPLFALQVVFGKVDLHAGDGLASKVVAVIADEG